MTDNLPAVVNDQPREVAKADTDSWIEVVGEVAKFAGYIAGTEFVPRSLRDSPAAATAAIMYGREVGLPPMTALTQTHVIEGRPSLSANAMRALVLAAGHEIQVVESTGAIVRMRGKRRGSQEWGAEVVWTIDMARAAGLTGKNNWKHYPRQMLTARASAELCTRDFPDVTLGFSSIEELEDLGGTEGEAIDAAPTTTRVGRTKKAAAPRRTPAALPAAEPKAASARPAGPPLPGEEGYETGETSAATSDEGSSPSHEEESGTTEDTAADVEPDPEIVVEETPDAPEETTDAPEQPTTDAPPEPTTDAPAEVTSGPRKASNAQTRMIFASLKALEVDDDRHERLLIASTILGRNLESFSDLESSDAKKIIDTLARCRTKVELNEVLDQFDPPIS